MWERSDGLQFYGLPLRDGAAEVALHNRGCPAIRSRCSTPHDLPRASHNWHHAVMGMRLIARRLRPAEHSAVLIDPNVATDLMDDEAAGATPGRTVDLDKAWHGVHFLLTGTAWDTYTDLGMAVLGGDPLGDDLGYGPVRLLDPHQVSRVSAALAALCREQLRRRFDRAQLSALEIYPDIWDDPDVLDGYLLPNLDDLVTFYAEAAAGGEAVLLAIT
jgi:hypothetical protein